MTMKALHHDQQNPTEGTRLCFVVSDHEAYESGFVPGHPRSDAGRTCVVKATESDSSLTDSLADSTTEGPRLSFVWPTTKETNLTSYPATLRLTKETNLTSCPPTQRQTKEPNLASCTAAHQS